MKATDKTYQMACGHCRSEFEASYKQHIRSRSAGTPVFCSDICLRANMRAKFSTPVPEKGPCLSCGDKFNSRREAKFCGMKCYTGSKQFTEMLAASREKSMTPFSIAKRAEQARRGEGRPCLECGTDVYAKKSEKSKKYCSISCYRTHMSKRFDRHIANPESLALPQAYDAFLDRDELPCLVAGCGWVGSHLSLHANQAHGIKADELKRAAGFNLCTGLVSRSLADVLRGRSLTGVAADDAMRLLGADNLALKQSAVRHYKSLEGAEHRAKARSLSGHGPVRKCVGCAESFMQTTVFGRAKYCSVACRAKHYSKLGGCPGGRKTNKQSAAIRSSA